MRKTSFLIYFAIFIGVVAAFLTNCSKVIYKFKGHHLAGSVSALAQLPLSSFFLLCFKFADKFSVSAGSGVADRMEF